MSSPGDKAAEAQQQQQKGPETFLTNDERKALQRTLGFPEDLPPKFKSWITDYLSVNFPQIPITQVSGFEKYLYKKGTAIPANPKDGQQYAYTVNAASGIVWRLQYNADSTSDYKWEFVGGSPLFVNADDVVSTTAYDTNWQDLGGPASTVPLAGDYLIQYGAEMEGNVDDRDVRTGIYDGSAVTAYINMEAVNGRRIALSKVSKITVSTAGATVGLRYVLGATPGTGGWQKRWIVITPIRVKRA